MHIDFHHALTYVACRLGGLPHDDASTIAHAAQYVDDATIDGPLTFATGERYTRITSAHKTIHHLNANGADNRMVWVPFHFLPGNEMPSEGSPPSESFFRRMMCKPDSPVARAMVEHCIERKSLPFALHRFGIALHTYADTWAHQQFVGIICDLNRVKKVKVISDRAYAGTSAYRDLVSGATKLATLLAGFVPVGHAAVNAFPDMPFLKWSFVRQDGEIIVRDNPRDFLDAAKGLFNMARRYVAGDVSLPDVDMRQEDVDVIDDLFRNTTLIHGEERHPVWLEAIRQGGFSFGPVDVSYVDQGVGSWKMTALGKR